MRISAATPASKQAAGWGRTVNGLVGGDGQDLRLPRVGLVAQVRPGGVAGAGCDARVQQRLRQQEQSELSFWSLLASECQCAALQLNDTPREQEHHEFSLHASPKTPKSVAPTWKPTAHHTLVRNPMITCRASTLRRPEMAGVTMAVCEKRLNLPFVVFQ